MIGWECEYLAQSGTVVGAASDVMKELGYGRE